MRISPDAERGHDRCYVLEEYGDIVAAGMLYAPTPRAIPPLLKTKSAIVIGGGISGICAGIGFSGWASIMCCSEKNEDFGGTGFENRYLGCGSIRLR